MDELIDDLAAAEKIVARAGDEGTVEQLRRMKRRLEECRAFFERFAAGEPPPENTTYEQWARELLA